MMTVSDIRGRLGLDTDMQVYRRFRILRPWIDQFVVRGKDNAILLKEGGFKALEVLQERVKAGQTLQQAAHEVVGQISEKPEDKPYQTHDNGEHSRCDQLISELRSRVDEQAKMIAYLQAKLDETLGKLPALPAPNPEQNGHMASRWERLKQFIQGH